MGPERARVFLRVRRQPDERGCDSQLDRTPLIHDASFPLMKLSLSTPSASRAVQGRARTARAKGVTDRDAAQQSEKPSSASRLKQSPCHYAGRLPLQASKTFAAQNSTQDVLPVVAHVGKCSLFVLRRDW